MGNSIKTEIARQLRRSQTIIEYMMWQHLRSKNLSGYRFYRQYVIGPFVVDFCCRSHKLVVELDGSQHALAKEYDEQRTNYLTENGYQVIRFWNNEYVKHPAEVLESILLTLMKRPHPDYVRPLPKGRGNIGRRPG